MKSCHIFIEFRLYKGYIKFDQLDLLGIQLSISFDTIFTTNVIFLGPILGSILVFPQAPRLFLPGILEPDTYRLLAAIPVCGR